MQVSEEAQQETQFEFKILLVDDCDQDADLLLRSLKRGIRTSFSCSRVGTAQEAVSAVMDQSFDIIFLDLGLPDSEGLHVLSQLYSVCPHVPILIVTGDEDINLLKQALECGAQDYLVKGSLPPESIARCVQSSLIRKKKEFELVKRSENKTKYLSEMSHEIRTPLNAILGMAEMISIESQDKKIKEYSTVQLNAGKSLLALINDVLDLSKIEAGKSELDLHAFDLCHVLNSSSDLISYRAKEKKLEYVFEANIEESMRFPIGDSYKIKQVLTNLLSNSLKFTHEGSISLLAKTENNQLLIEVKDTGIGIKKENISKLFGEFSQEFSSTVREFGGTGLGLAICKRLVEMMGGEIKVSSQEGVGSSFFVNIPLRPSALNAPEVTGFTAENKEPTKDLEIEKLNGKSLLIADDDEANRFILKSFLKKASLDIEFVENGKDALSAMMNKEYDFVLLDIQMPELTGIEVVKSFRNWEKLNRKNRQDICAASAGTSAGEVAEALEAGYDWFLSKPISRTTLIQSLLERISSKAVDPKKGAA